MRVEKREGRGTGGIIGDENGPFVYLNREGKCKLDRSRQGQCQV